jgi:hypothetical protein
MLCQCCNPMRNDEAPAPVGTRLLFMRVAPVHDERGAIESLGKEPSVGIDFEPIDHFAIMIGDHPVGGDDGIAFNTNRSRHRGHPRVSRGDQILLACKIHYGSDSDPL